MKASTLVKETMVEIGGINGVRDMARRQTNNCDDYFFKPNTTMSSQTVSDELVTCVAVKEDRHQNMSSVVL